MALLKTTKRLSRRKGSTTSSGSGSRWSASQYVFCMMIGFAAVAVLVLVSVLRVTNNHQPDSSVDNDSNESQPRSNQLRQAQDPVSLTGKGQEKGHKKVNADTDHKALRRDTAKGHDKDTTTHLATAEDGNSSPPKETLILSTDVGEIRIVLMPQYSAPSVQYIHELVDSGHCDRCTFYRAEKKGILQGIIKSKTINAPVEKGSCPPGMEKVATGKCPEWDPSCACHGPLMERGMVGWAAGKTGPDFFIDDYRAPAKWWGTQHTVWGQIMDDKSLNVIDHIWSLPATRKGGLTYLNSHIQFTMRIEIQSQSASTGSSAVA